MIAGIPGAAKTFNVRGTLVPQELLALTESTQVVKLPGQSTEIALRFAGPTIVPHDVLQLYEVAIDTGAIEYETPV